MKIKEITLSDILSFGPTQTIKNLNQFNLFIGKNGTGKTNVLNLLSGLKTELHEAVADVSLTYSSYARHQSLYSVRMPYSMQNRNMAESRDRGKIHSSGLEIKFTDNEVENITFQDGFLKSGNLENFKKRVSVITPEVSFLQLRGEMRRREKYNYWAVPLSFGLHYIFEKPISFTMTGELFDQDNRNPKNPNMPTGCSSSEPDILSSGQEYCAKLIIQILFAGKEILLVDEPETHLEPRANRRLHNYIVWLLTHNLSQDDLSNGAIKMRARISEAWNGWKRYHGRNILIEKQSKNLISDEKVLTYPPKQLIMASHSNVLINEFLSLGDMASVYEFSSPYVSNNHPIEWTMPEEERVSHKVKERETKFSKVEKINTRPLKLLESLGCKGADLLQTNGIIWVEGPSDVILIRKWMEMYCHQKQIPKFEQGLHYEFQIFGGAILDSISLENAGISDDIALKKLVEMFSFSRNAYIIIDSDAVKKDGVIFDNSKFQKAKLLIKRQVEESVKNGLSVGIWFDEGEITPKTIEDYIDADSLKEIGKRTSSTTKKNYAQKLANFWTNDYKLSKFPHGLESQIHNLITMVNKWNAS